MGRLRTSFIEGLIVFLPFALTIYALYLIFSSIYGILALGKTLVPACLLGTAHARLLVDVAVLFFCGVFIVLVGVLARTVIGQAGGKLLDGLMRPVPLLHVIYRGLKQIFAMVFQNEGGIASRSALVEFPQPGERSLGLVTGEAEAELKPRPRGRYYKVFVPTVPNPTSGFLIIYKKKDVRFTDLTSEQVARVILSGGILPEKEEARNGAAPEKKEGLKSFWSRLQIAFVEGIIILLPIVLSLYFSYLVFLFVYRLMSFGVIFIPPQYRQLVYLRPLVTLFTIFLTLVFICLSGLGIKTLIGRRVNRAFESLIISIPLSRSLFRAFKQLLQLVVAKPAQSYSQVVLVSFPHRGCHSLGFITGKASAALLGTRRRKAGEHYKVFIPATPNPTVGFMLVVPAGDLIFTRLSVDRALRLVVSGGILK